MVNLVALFTFTLSLAAGQILFKKTALTMSGLQPMEGLRVVLLQPLLYVALALYGFTTCLWIWLLSRIPLTQAHPFMAASIIVVPILSVFLLGERVTFVFWIGAVFVTLGVVLTQFGIVR
jgi:drug/metabolite transporter (DMT)-like permease